tara:strand:- start:356 stop:661 length:306 start_codon:yes stop_codon:yes gene_type:complete
MKLGDLVTLSAAALKRDTLFYWSQSMPEDHRKPKPIGMIVEVTHGKIGWVGSEQSIYKIKWVTPNAPRGREGNHGYMNSHYEGLFYRRDLKYVSKRKVKKA